MSQLICNRTKQDVENAKILRENLQNGETLTNEQIQVLERGTITINTLNRIEQKQSELEGVLNELRYMVHIPTKTDWTAGDIFTFQDHQRLLSNLDSLKQAYYTYITTPDTPTYVFDWQKANDIEKILVDIEKMINDMILRFRECGTFECGEVNNL